MPVEVDQIKAVFLTALEKTAPADRAAYLDEVCAGNAPFRQRIEALLEAHDRPDRLLDQPAMQHIAAAESAGTLDCLEPSEYPGSLGRLGHYEVLEVVGRGGMGVVLRAFDEKLHRVVAIKALSPALAVSGSSRHRFVREARATAAVNHDNVIAIHAVEDTGPVPYLVMQFIDGCTLQQKLDRTGPLPLKEILRLGIQIAEGLAAAHRHGLGSV
jgi:serine/threonine protein kinase